MQDIIEFFERLGLETSRLIGLVAEFETGLPPSIAFFPEHGPVSYRYSSRRPEALEAGIQEFVIETLLAGYLDKPYFNPFIEFKKQFAFNSALTYSVLGIGNCNHRAAYAALKLSRLLALAGWTVTLVNHYKESIVQSYYLMLTKGSTKRVYDPWTNPRLIFKVGEHQEQVILKMPRCGAIHYDLEFSKDVMEEFETRSQEIAVNMAKKIRDGAHGFDKRKSICFTASRLIKRPIRGSQLSEACEKLIKKAEAHLSKDASGAPTVEVTCPQTVFRPKPPSRFKRIVCCGATPT